MTIKEKILTKIDIEIESLKKERSYPYMSTVYYVVLDNKIAEAETIRDLISEIEDV